MELNSEQQKKIFEIQMMEQKMKQLEAQMEAIQRQVIEMHGIIDSLSALDKGAEEVLLPLGKGIFVKNKNETKNVMLNIGSGIIVEKSATDTVKLIREQIDKLNEMKQDYQREVIDASRKIEEMISELQA